MSKRTDETRRRVLEASCRLLTTGSAAEVRMGDIAGAAGISRQALYKHFATRAELLVAVARFVDEEKDIDGRLQRSRDAAAGTDRLRHFIAAWCNYIPVIFPFAQALLAVYDTDADAASAWDNRMQALREGCEAAVTALLRDGMLQAGIAENGAAEAVAAEQLWVLLSVRNWEQWTRDCGWTQAQYVSRVQAMASRLLVSA